MIKFKLFNKKKGYTVIFLLLLMANKNNSLEITLHKTIFNKSCFFN